MALPGTIEEDGRGPVAESVDARALHCSLSWFKSRPGLQPSLALRATATQASPKPLPKTAKCRLTARFWGFRASGIWSKDRVRARACLTLAFRFRSSHDFAATSDANFEIKRTLATC